MTSCSANATQGRLRPRRVACVAALAVTLSICGVASAVCGVASASARPITVSRSHVPYVDFAKMPKSQIKIAIVAGGPNVYFAPWPKAVAAAAKATGVTMNYFVPPTPTLEPAVEISTIDSLVAKGYNAFAVFPDGEAAMIPLYTRLAARGIPVIDLSACTTSPTPAVMCLATNVRTSALQQTQILIKAIGGKGNLAFLTGELTDPNTIQREQGVKQAVDDTQGKVKLVQIVSNIDSPSTAPPAVESLLASKGSKLNGMVSTDEYPSIAAASIMTKDPQFRHVTFIGQDNDPSVMNAIAKHYIYGTMFSNSYGETYVAAMWLYQLLAKGCTANYKGGAFATAEGTNHFVDAGALFVGQSNVSQFVGKFESDPTATAKLIGETSRVFSCP
jgi:ribose transport system substrate-binding protein